MNNKFSDIFLFLFFFFNYNTTEAFQLRTMLFFMVNMTSSIFQCLTSWLDNCFLLAIPLTYEHYTYKRGRQWVTLKRYNNDFCCRNLINNKKH